MMERLEKAFETQKRFIADASHELRTPLTAIRGNADLMRIAPPEERDVCLTAIRREAERMSRLVTDLLLLAEADVEQQPVDKRPVDLDQLVTEVYRSALAVAGGRVSVELEPADAVRIPGDPDRLKQLILNLMDNAIKFTPDGGAVNLSLIAEADGARIEVVDSGIGIAPEEQEAIFERFYRVEQSRARKGSGLGLAICAWIVHAHGGTIDVRSASGKGSTFTVRLPGGLLSQPAQTPAPQPRPQKSQAPS
jgi:signal transduction histidine kinase